MVSRPQIYNITFRDYLDAGWDLTDASPLEMNDIFRENPNITFGEVLNITDPNCQEMVVRILMDTFTDRHMIDRFIRKFSPTEELVKERIALWRLLT